jgi:hypothetical protein
MAGSLYVPPSLLLSATTQADALPSYSQAPGPNAPDLHRVVVRWADRMVGR